MPARKTRCGYTLVEILLVIAIIGVLAALLFAVMAPVRKKAYERVCISNLHQLGKAFSLYITDYDGVDAVVGARMLPSALGIPPRKAINVFKEQYAGTREGGVFFCPASSKRPQESWGASYSLSAIGNNHPPSEEGYNELLDAIQKRGDRLPTIICPDHRDDQQYAVDPVEKQADPWVHVLRLNGQVQRRQLQSGEISSFDW